MLDYGTRELFGKQLGFDFAISLNNALELSWTCLESNAGSFRIRFAPKLFRDPIEVLFPLKFV